MNTLPVLASGLQLSVGQGAGRRVVRIVRELSSAQCSLQSLGKDDVRQGVRLSVCACERVFVVTCHR